MSKIYRDDFASRHRGQSIDIDKASRSSEARTGLDQAGMSVDDLRRADRNRDGKVDASEAWKAADDFDNDGTRGSLIDVDRAGQPTDAGKAAGAFGALLAKGELQPSNDGIVLVGMNEDNKHEARNLRRQGANVIGVHDSAAGNDKISSGGRTYDLTDGGQRLAFAQSLGLPPEQTQKIADAIGSAKYDGWGSAQTDAMDEVAQLAKIWAKAEHGGAIPSRMIISGHHVGSAVWGDDNGEVSWGTLQKLADAMPRAAAQVEDLNVSACYSGGAQMQSKYEGIFPNLKTVWAYSGSAPGSWSGAMAHQKYWERATRGDGTDLQGTIDTLKSWGTRKAENIVGTEVEAPQAYNGPPLSELRQRLRQGEPAYQRYFTGEEVVRDRQSGPLRQYYSNAIQTALQHPDLPDGERASIESLRDQCIRTLFYTSHIGPKFAREHRASITSGYQALGLTPPDFSNLSRRDAMQAIDQYRAALDAARNPPQAAQDLLPLLNGLWNLDPRVIPQNWI